MICSTASGTSKDTKPKPRLRPVARSDITLERWTVKRPCSPPKKIGDESLFTNDCWMDDVFHRWRLRMIKDMEGCTYWDWCHETLNKNNCLIYIYISDIKTWLTWRKYNVRIMYPREMYMSSIYIDVKVRCGFLFGDISHGPNTTWKIPRVESLDPFVSGGSKEPPPWLWIDMDVVL